MAKEEEEEVAAEVEAVEAVYGDDCKVIQRFPPILHIHLKPRTADDSSQQFVEAVIDLHASFQYPKEPPCVGVVDSKGLDEKRQINLITSMKMKAIELSSSPMLVALCEEAVELLSNMNHPDGNCPLCLCPLVKEDAHGDLWPFMKLMSCFHCFHSKCIVGWWKWLQEQHGSDPSYSSHTDLNGAKEEKSGSCPVCRRVFHAKDIEHVLALIEESTSQLNLVESENEDDAEILQSEAECIRRQKFEALSKVQEEKNGLIETKRHEVLLPGVFLPEPIRPPTTSSSEETTSKQQQTEAGPSRFLRKPNSSSGYRNYSMSKDSVRHKSKQKKTKWIKREKENTD